MERENLLDNVKNIIAQQLKIDIENIQEDTRFVDELRMDSLHFVRLSMVIEQSFNVRIFLEDDTVELKTVGQAVDQIEKALANQSLKIQPPHA
jgi:acyl carrier protein